jgi:hypothetical protein
VAVAAHATDSDAFLIRTWGREHGFVVKDTGRIPEQVLKAYAKAHGGELITS